MVSYNLRSKIIQGGKVEVHDLIDTHPLYRNYLPRWTMLADSYAGGMEYEIGEYLERYYYENQEEYIKRLRVTALDNHVKGIIGIYNSFLYRQPIVRDLDSLDPMMVKSFMEDADLDGRSFERSKHTKYGVRTRVVCYRQARCASGHTSRRTRARHPRLYEHLHSGERVGLEL